MMAIDQGLHLYITLSGAALLALGAARMPPLGTANRLRRTVYATVAATGMALIAWPMLDMLEYDAKLLRIVQEQNVLVEHQQGQMRVLLALLHDYGEQEGRLAE